MYNIVITFHRELNNSTTINQFQVLGAKLNASTRPRPTLTTEISRPKILALRPRPKLLITAENGCVFVMNI